MTAKVDDVIQPGQTIPEDVIAVDDSTGVAWQRVGEWPSWRAGSLHYDEKHLIARRAPLTVTAVREQPAEPGRKCPGCGDRPHVGASCIEARDARAEQPSAESVPDILDLVRQFGAAQYGAGYQVASLDAAKADREVAEAGALFERIGVEVQRLRDKQAWLYRELLAITDQRDSRVLSLPQALHYSGMPLWLHACGVPTPWTTPTKDTPCANCAEPGPWRPLLVGGDPAAEQPKATHDDFKRLAGIKGNSPRHLLAQVMAELGVDRPEDVLITIQKRAAAFRRTCEAAELRKQQRNEARADRDDWERRFNEQADRGDQAAQQMMTLRRERDAARAEVERLKRAVKLGQTARTELEGRLANGQGPWPAEPGPLRLTLPEVPPGARTQDGPLAEVLDEPGATS